MDEWNDMGMVDADLQNLLDEPFLDESCSGFNALEGSTWIYPSNLPVRAYQLSITQAALFKNTLVVLPTGLGKTFIAAVVMYNIYRWYPAGKVIFLAPTRPLVAQQIAACKRIMPLPTQDTVELTGKLPRHKRFECWRTKRVFFATPQSVQSDLIGNEHDAVNQFPFDKIKLLVIDEAHKAKGRFAYTEVVQAIWRRNRNFRVLALSATPGRTVDDVAEVVRNLFISHIELRWDNSVDVMPYVHQRSIKTIVVPLGDNIKKVYAELIEIIDPYERQLIDSGVISGSCHNISRNFLLFEQKRFRERSLRQSHTDQSTINSNFSICISLYHALELLERHGLRIFVNYFEQDEEGRSKFIYNLDTKLRQLIDRLRSELGPNPFDTSINAMTNGQIAQMPRDLDFGHPKFEQARKCLLEHFDKHPISRAIVFCEYRESVLLVYRLLLQHVPVLKPRCFAGQGGSGNLRALTQKQQIQIMQDFREGKSNVLVATSIAEEGIDVGEVELIVCFDISSANPTRFVQRIGRTGRQKKGNVVMLVTEGREQRLLKDVQANKDQTNKKLLRSPVIQAALYKAAPRLVPKHLTPKCEQQFVQAVEELAVEDAEVAPKKSKTKTKVKAVEKGSQDLRKFFNNKPNTAKKKNKTAQVIDLDEDDLEIFEVAAPPGQATQKELAKSFKERFGELDFSDIALKSNSQIFSAETVAPVESTPAPVADFNDSFQKLNLAVVNMKTCEEELLSSGPSQTRESKHIRKVNKLLQNRAPLVDIKKKCDIYAVIKSKQISKHSKLLFLQGQRKFVKDILNKINILKAVEVEVDVRALSKEEQQIQDCYQHLLEIYEDEHALKRFVYDQQTYEVADTTDYLVDSQDFQASLQDIFHDLNGNLFTRDNFEFIQNEFKKTLQYQRILSKENVVLNEGSMEEEVDMMEEEEENSALNLEDISDMNSRYQDYYDKQLQMENEVVEDHFETDLLSERDFLELGEESNSLCNIELALSTESVIENKDTTNTSFSEFSAQAGSALAKSTPLNVKHQQKKSHMETATVLLDRLNECDEEEEKRDVEETPDIILNNETIDELPEEFLTAAPKVEKVTTEADIQTQLDEDLDVFLEAFQEEEKFFTAKGVKNDSQKENVANTNVVVASDSPDLFEISDMKEQSKKSVKTPIKSPIVKTQKSPSIFESYWQRVQLNKLKKMNSVINGKKLLQTHAVSQITDTKKSKSPVRSRTQEAESKVHNSWDSDFEEIAPSQEEKSPSLMRPLKKRRLCEFIENEVNVSETDHSSDEADETMGHYMLDSVVVHDDEAEHEQCAATHSKMHALYLQSVKSPTRLQGAFKIPQYKTFNDHDQIFSQTMDVVPSQYVPDSFVVEEDNDDASVIEVSEEEVTMCPLERAEMILKQRKKERRQQRLHMHSPKKAKKRKVYRISDSSDDE